MDQREILQALAAAVGVVDDRRDAFLSERMGVVVAIFRYLLEHPESMPKPGIH